MIRRYIAIALLLLFVIAVFTVAIWLIMPHDKKVQTENSVTNSAQPMVRISDIIGEAVYMGSYSTDAEIFADEPFAAKDVLRSALAKSAGTPENVAVMIESYNYETLSVVFDDGRTMRTLEQPGTGNVMIVASIPKGNGDVFYAYNVQIDVKESRTPKNTEAPEVSEGVTTSVWLTTAPSWNWEWDEEDVTEAVTTKKTWSNNAKTTTAAAAIKPSATAKVTAAASPSHVITEKPAEKPVTEAPPPSVEPESPSPAEQPSVAPSVAEPEPQQPEPEPEPEPQPEPQPEPEPEPEPVQQEAAQE